MLSNCFDNIILNTDSYKASHYLQFPPNTTHVSCYIESRGGEFDTVLFFGLQLFIEQHLTTPITLADINEADSLLTAHGLPFHRDGWLHILEKHNGYLPVTIEALPEGTTLPTQNVLLQITNTDPNCFWLPTYLETALLRAIWYPTTVATISWHAKQLIASYLEKTADDASSLAFQLHDFGARGTSSQESAAIGGLAHLVNFYGTDTLSGVLAAKHYYDCPMAGFSIPAAEHATIISWGKEQETQAYANCIQQFSGDTKAFAVVSDSYNIWNALDNLWGGELANDVQANPGRLVIRPDSGDPATIPTQVIQHLMNRFGYTKNKKGYRVLPDNLRVIQGDGISLETINECLNTMKDAKLCSSNIAFGMGGALLQKCHRDTLSFAMKANAVCRDGIWRDIFKQPITDSHKTSKPGRLALIKDEEGYKTIPLTQLGERKNQLKPVFRDGKPLRKTTFDEIRKRSVV